MTFNLSLVLTYPARVERDGPADWAIVFPDVPEAVSGADTEAEAWAQAAEVLALALCSYPARKLPFPKPSRPGKRDRMISIPVTHAAKLFIRQAMAEQDLSVANLARLAKTDHKSARRIIALSHKTRMEPLESVLAMLGVRTALMAA